MNKYFSLKGGIKLLTLPLLLIFNLSNVTFATEYIIDKSHSEISFNLKHLTISKISGGFHDYNATIKWDKNNLTESEFSSIISVKSINTHNEKRDSHLKENDFFDANKFPYIKFKSNSITKKNNIYYVEGNLTIKNYTKQISFPLITTGPVEDLSGKKRFVHRQRLHLAPARFI